MGKKHIKAISADAHSAPGWDARRTIRDLLAVLDGFNDETDGGYIARDAIRISIGNRTAETYFCPTTWDYAETFLKYNIGFLITECELDKYPYYAKILDRFQAEMNVCRDAFEAL